MGAVYNVELTILFNNEQDVIDATQAFVDAHSHFAVFSNVDYSSIISAIQIILPERGFHITNHTATSLECDCGFNASYGWESIMQDWFNYLVETSAVLDRSTIAIYPDSGWEKGVAKSNTVHWVNDEGFKWGAGADAYEVQIPEKPTYYRQEEPERIPMVVDDSELQEVIDLINDYGEDEFDHIIVTEDSNLSDIGLMYTTAENDEYEWDVQASVDLLNHKILYYVNDELKGEDTYPSLAAMIDESRVWLDFGNLYSNCCDYIDWDKDPWGDDDE